MLAPLEVGYKAALLTDRTVPELRTGLLIGVGGVAKWSKATVCKTVIRRFESARRLLFTCLRHRYLCAYKALFSLFFPLTFTVYYAIFYPVRYNG